ncbi:MAG: HEAT repeat domain-containing protein [Candidatus Thorarchaeota archaeon]
MGTNKKTIEEYLDDLANWDDSSREEAAQILGDIGDESVIEPLFDAFKNDDSEDVRAAIVRSLSKFDSSPIVPKTLGEIIVTETSPIVRVAIANAIGNLGNLQAARAMIQILEQEESIWVREAIIDSFGKLKNKEFVPIIIQRFKSDDTEEVRIQAAKSLLKLADFLDLDDVLTLFDSEKSDMVKSYIVEIIAEIPDLKSVELLSTALDDDDFSLTQAAAAEALHKIAVALGYEDENDMMDSI